MTTTPERTPEVMYRLAYGHLDRETWRTQSDLALITPRLTPLARILESDTHTGGVVGFAGIPQRSPAIIVHNRPPDQIEVRLRWLSARVDVDGPLGWLYAPDVADMMLDRGRVEANFAEFEECWPFALLRWLERWARLQAWGKEPVIR